MSLMVKKLIKSMRQAPNLGRLLCKSKFISAEETFHINPFGKNCACYQYLLNSYLFKRVNKIILIARAETLFKSLFVKAAKKSILARLAVW